jgi:hypothetical protein
MTRIFSMATMMALSTLAIAPASSQQLQQPVQQPITPATPPAQDTGVGPRLNGTRPGQPPAVPANPSQRPPASDPIPSEGPSRPAARSVIKPVEPVERNVPTQVLDDKGRLVPGAVKISPDRAYDPATGRYFQTMPTPRPR